MFGMKDRAMQVKFVKTEDANKLDTVSTEDKMDIPEIAKIAMEYTIKTVGAIGIVLVANKFVNTACEIAVIAAKAKLK